MSCSGYEYEYTHTHKVKQVLANDNFRNKIPKHKSIMIELAHAESQSCSNTNVIKTYSAYNPYFFQPEKIK